MVLLRRICGREIRGCTEKGLLRRRAMHGSLLLLSPALGLGIGLSEVTAPGEPSLEAVTALDVAGHPLATHSAAVVH